MLRLNVLLTILFLSSSLVFSQTVYEPVKSEVYDFLDRLANKRVISINDEVRPYSRGEIADYLLTAQKNSSLLNTEEENELLWYLQEYKYETGETGIKDRIRLYKYVNKEFQLSVSPIAGYGISYTGDKSSFNRTIGARVYMSYSNWFGGSIHARDNGEFGDNVDKYKYLSPLRGYDPIQVKNGFEYSDVRAQINFAWNWGQVSLRKDYLQWGNGYSGQIILSDKAPSYPHLFFKLKPVNWFRFYFVYGMLHSGIIDSSATIKTGSSIIEDYNFETFVPKHFVANLLTFTPYQLIDFSLGNYAVYAGDFRPEMLIPFNFFKYMDRDTGKKSIQDVNGGLFFNLQVRYPEKFKFYSSLFIDVTSIRGILKNDLHETWAGYTFGVRSSSFIYENIDFIAEYTRLNPWVYEHKYGSLTNYQHLSYPLGHWIGQNSDNFLLKFIYYPIRGLIVDLAYQRFRKGGLKDIYYAYGGASASTIQPFLYSPVRREYDFKFNASYRIIHELRIKFNYTYSDISDEDANRTLAFLLGAKNSYSLSLYYGL